KTLPEGSGANIPRCSMARVRRTIDGVSHRRQDVQPSTGTLVEDRPDFTKRFLDCMGAPSISVVGNPAPPRGRRFAVDCLPTQRVARNGNLRDAGANEKVLTDKTMRITVLLAWFDCWVGVFSDQKRRILYVLPVPMRGLTFHRPTRS